MQIEKSIVVNTIGEKLLIILLETNKILQTLRESIGGYSTNENKHKLQIFQRFLTFGVEPPTFQRPSMIDLPIKGFNSIVQDNVKRTKMGHGNRRASFGNW